MAMLANADTFLVPPDSLNSQGSGLRDAAYLFVPALLPVLQLAGLVAVLDGHAPAARVELHALAIA